MTRANDSIFSIIGTFLFLIVALGSLVFFVQHRDPAGFLAWVFGFAAILSGTGSTVPSHDAAMQR